MKSIRTYLLFALLAIITVVTFFSLLHGYQASITKAEQLFDQRLKDLAEIIATSNQDIISRKQSSAHYSSKSFFQIWSKELLLLLRSDNAPSQFLSNTKNAAQFNDVNYKGYRWRTYTLYDQRLNRWVVTGERTDLRQNIAENIVTASIIPIVLAIPLAAIVIWWAIGLGLKPLKIFALQLSNKQVDDLSPIILQNTPEELTQLVTTTNALLARLNAAFLREQHFSADAAHELRTPISTLKVLLHNLQQNHKYGGELIPLVAAVERMAYVTEQILSLYHHSPEQAMLKHDTVDLTGIVQKVIADNYEFISSKGQQVSLTAEAFTVSNASAFALETMVQNLILNASKYTPDEGEIRITLSEISLNNCLIIEDSGPGIVDSELKRVFERFYRINGDQHDSGIMGCGLGLAIVKHIVELHHAQIKLEKSEFLGGLKVLVIFPKQGGE